jgi:acetyl-CoA C-acetyltransferase
VSAGRPDDGAPCIIGVGQVTARDVDPVATEPLALWSEAARLAVSDCGTARAPGRLDELAIVCCDSWLYDDPGPRLAARAGLQVTRHTYSPLGGAQPQLLLHALADDIAAGRAELGMVVSGEALATVESLRRAGAPLPWPHGHAPGVPEDLSDFFSRSELQHGMLPIMRSFALRDSARRAARGAGLDEYAHEAGPLCAAMSQVAATNPLAWSREARSAGDILGDDHGNWMPVRPYRKFMMARPNVNQAAALVVASHARADALGVPPDRRVYLRGWAAAKDHPYVAANVQMGGSAGMRSATGRALGAADCSLDDVAKLDLYSCFPAAVRFAADALGLAVDDARGVTVTGGLPFFGAPGSGYMTHALASMVTALRVEGSATGLVSGLSAQMSSHACTVLSPTPGRGDPRSFGQAAPAPPADGPIALRDAGRGPARLEAYAVACRPDGSNQAAVAVCGLPEGGRCYAKSDEAEVLVFLSDHEGVGRPVTLVGAPDGGTEFRL